MADKEVTGIFRVTVTRIHEGRVSQNYHTLDIEAGSWTGALRAGNLHTNNFTYETDETRYYREVEAPAIAQIARAYPIPTPEHVTEAIERLTAYNYDDEEKDFYDHSPDEDDGHIFLDILRIKYWLRHGR